MVLPWHWLQLLYLQESTTSQLKVLKTTALIHLGFVFLVQSASGVVFHLNPAANIYHQYLTVLFSHLMKNLQNNEILSHNYEKEWCHSSKSIDDLVNRENLSSTTACVGNDLQLLSPILRLICWCWPHNWLTALINQVIKVSISYVIICFSSVGSVSFIWPVTELRSLSQSVIFLNIMIRFV